MNYSAVTFSSKMAKSDERGKTLLFIVYPDRSTTSIVPALPFQDVGHLAFTTRRHARCPYGIHCLFNIIFFSSEYSYFYYVYIVRVSYSRLYCSFNILFLSSYIFFLLNMYYIIPSVYLLFDFDQYVVFVLTLLVNL